MGEQLKKYLNSGSDRVRLRKGFFKALTHYGALAVGFSLWWAWMSLVYQSAAVFPAITIADRVVPTSLGPLLCIAVSLLVVAASYRKYRFVLRGLAYYAIVCVAMMVGAALCAVWCALDYQLNFAGVVLWGASSMFVGASSAFMYVEFNRIMGWFGLLRTLYFAICAALLGAFVAYLLASLPLSMMHALLVVIPPCMTATLVATIRRESLSDDYFGHGGDSDLPIPHKFNLTSIAEGASGGLILGSITVSRVTETSFETILFGYLAATALLVLVVFVLKLDFNRLIYQVGFPLIGLAFLIVASSSGDLLAGRMVQLVGYCLLDVLLWGLGSYLIKNVSLPAMWIAACPSGALFMGYFAGGICGVAFVQPLSEPHFAEFFSVVAFALVLAALFLFNKSNFEYGWGMISPGKNECEAEPYAECCKYLASEYGLTAREGDVLLLLAKNTARREIAQQLYVSENTVKTHTRNVFRKLQVSTREELRALVRQTDGMMKGELIDKRC